MCLRVCVFAGRNCAMLGQLRYDVVLAASKGISELLLTVRRLGCSVCGGGA